MKVRKSLTFDFVLFLSLFDYVLYYSEVVFVIFKPMSWWYHAHLTLSSSALQTCGPDCGKVHQKGEPNIFYIPLQTSFFSSNMINSDLVFSVLCLQCKPEYKVAGLYVVDSIVRQSRHQFGPDKDVFGPRFTKNITGTFENLCLCPVEDRVRPEIVGGIVMWDAYWLEKL